MIDYEARLQEREAELRIELRTELRAENVRSIVKSWHKLGQDYTDARVYVLEECPDIDMELLDSIISEVYNLQEINN